MNYRLNRAALLRFVLLKNLGKERGGAAKVRLLQGMQRFSERDEAAVLGQNEYAERAGHVEAFPESELHAVAVIHEYRVGGEFFGEGYGFCFAAVDFIRRGYERRGLHEKPSG